VVAEFYLDPTTGGQTFGSVSATFFEHTRADRAFTDP